MTMHRGAYRNKDWDRTWQRVVDIDDGQKEGEYWVKVQFYRNGEPSKTMWCPIEPDVPAEEFTDGPKWAALTNPFPQNVDIPPWCEGFSYKEVRPKQDDEPVVYRPVDEWVSGDDDVSEDADDLDCQHPDMPDEVREYLEIIGWVDDGGVIKSQPDTIMYEAEDGEILTFERDGYKDPVALAELYWGYELSQHQIGDIFGVTQTAISDHMVKHNVPRRPPAGKK